MANIDKSLPQKSAQDKNILEIKMANNVICYLKNV